MKITLVGIPVLFALAIIISTNPAYAPCPGGSTFNCNNYPESNQFDNPQIINLKVFPSEVKVGDKFTVIATLVNNSTVPIIVEGGKCSIKDTQAQFFTIMFDNHTKIMPKNMMTCAGVGWSQILDPGKKITGTSPDYTLDYAAMASGTANTTVTFSYRITNQTDLTQPGIEKTISKSFQFLIHDVNEKYAQKPPAYFASPLQQIKAGGSSQSVKCGINFSLVIKSEDGSPACVKTDTAKKLMERGWAKESIPTVRTTSSNLKCDGSVLPSGDVRTGIVPVLMMKPNSTATVCIAYKFNSDWSSYPNKNIYPHGIFETSCCNFDPAQYSNKQSYNKFEVLADPPQFNITGVYNGAKVTVMYKIHAESNSTGFYNSSVPFGNCNSYPLAVGYDSSQISASDFSSYRLDIPCFNTIDAVDSVKIVSGMTYKEINLW